MTHKEKTEAAIKLMKRIKELPIGSRVTTAMLLHDVFGKLPDDELAPFEINRMLFSLAKKEGYFLDDTEHHGKEEGLPYDLDFVIRKIK